MHKKIKFFSVKLQDIPDLMRWGRAVMGSSRANYTKEQCNFLRMMIIFDYPVIEQGDDEDELLVMSISELGVLKGENKHVYKNFLKPLVNNKTLKDKVNFQEATFVYFLEE